MLFTGCTSPAQPWKGFTCSGSDVIHGGYPCKAQLTRGHQGSWVGVETQSAAPATTYQAIQSVRTPHERPLQSVVEHAVGSHCIMSGHVGHQIRLSASRIRPRILQPLGSSGKCLPHEPQPRQTLISSLTQLYGCVQRRHFGAADAAGTLLKGSELLFTNIHHVTGAPWFVSIPLVALAVGAAIRMPLTFYSHELARRRARLVPLIQAQTAMVGRGLRRKTQAGLRERVGEIMKKRGKALIKAFGLTQTRSILGSLVSLPIFLSNIEVIRRMCGGPRGLLGNLVFGSTASSSASAAVAKPVEGISASASPVVDAATAPETAENLALGVHDSLASIAIEPSLATGGCLWFPNLLEADPYHILPLSVSVALVLNMMPTESAARRELFGLPPANEDKQAIVHGQSRSRRGLQRAMLLVALSIGPVTMDMPAALHLYWLTSATFSLAVSKGLKAVRPLPKNNIKPCRGMEVPLLRPKPT